MMKACPKASTCPFWDGGVFLLRCRNTFAAVPNIREGQALLYRARQHPLPCGTTCLMVSSITPRAQSCLPASPQRSLTSWLSFSPYKVLPKPAHWRTVMGSITSPQEGTISSPPPLRQRDKRTSPTLLWATVAAQKNQYSVTLVLK